MAIETTREALRAFHEGTAAGHALGALTEAGAEPVTDLREGLHGPSLAVFGGNGAYRYLLTRRWAPGPVMTWVMLNPSTADASADDPTIARCWRRAAAAGSGAIAVVNLFALRATDPRELLAHPDPAGPGNDACLTAVCGGQDAVVAAWGAHGDHLGRGRHVAQMLTAAGARLVCLGTTAAGHPRHPLYIPAAAPLVPWRPPAIPADLVSRPTLHRPGAGTPTSPARRTS